MIKEKNMQQNQPASRPPNRVIERKIGRTTFIVSSSFNESKEKDIVSTVARLIQHETMRPSA